MFPSKVKKNIEYNGPAFKTSRVYSICLSGHDVCQSVLNVIVYLPYTTSENNPISTALRHNMIYDVSVGVYHLQQLCIDVGFIGNH